ncbi:MAG: ABC transporter ATP-binding protein [Firmicutes bacterium]|nr:ABC transporter ATP-binding protein [Bacillota bacterium]MDD4791702.1 ABC transporter ATP-binding protein [Bacillota bacterium]
MGKAYDSRLMRRLMSYAKPYRNMFVLAIIVIMIIAGTDLVRPYLIKTAIDNHISGYNAPMARYEPDGVPEEIPASRRMEYGGHVYVRMNDLPEEDRSAADFQLLSVSGKYVLISGVLPPDHGDVELATTDSGTSILADGVEYPGQIIEGRENIAIFRKQDVAAVSNLAIIVLLVGAVAFLLNYGQTVLLHKLGQRIVYGIRQEVFTHLQNLDVAFFDKNPVGRLVTRVTNDTETLNEMYTSVIVNLFKDVFMLVGIVVVMFRLNTQLAMLSLATLPLIIVSTIVFRTRARQAYRRLRTTLARINATLAENISGMKVVQIFNRQRKNYDQFVEVNREYYQAGIGQMMVYAIFRPIIELISTGALALIVWHGGRNVIAGTMQFGMVYAFINYIGMFFRPINDLTEKYNIMQSAMASSERLSQLMNTRAVVADTENPVSVDRLNGRIEFKNVWFAYNETDWVLKDINFTIEPGEVVAFVGATGAGKTSITSLINRLYDIQKGQILIDGVDIRNYKVDDLRRNIAAVLQDVFLFTGDMKSNIRLNNEEISDERIKEVARYVNADHFISRLPKGYDEPVTERGSTLSAGQRQLLAFARALAFDPSILVLDEATANIDTETELLIQDALPKLIAGRTTIVVAHRLSTIQHADKIIVIHKGRIREVGTHQELLSQRGLYYDLYRLQYKDELMPEEEPDDYIASASACGGTRGIASSDLADESDNMA